MFLIMSDKINDSFIQYNTEFDFKAIKIHGKGKRNFFWTKQFNEKSRAV